MEVYSDERIAKKSLLPVDNLSAISTIELSHAGHKSVNREADQKAPTGVGCSDLVELSRCAASGLRQWWHWRL